MNKKVPFSVLKKEIFAFFLLGFVLGTHAQTTVFSDDFAASAGTSYTTSAGAIGTSAKWNLATSGTDFGGRIDNGIMGLTDDATGASNVGGWALGYANTSSFVSPYNTTLASNPGMVTWTFNMRQPQANPSGFASGYYGLAFVLAGTSGTTRTTGTGYAVTLGNAGKTDPVKLVSYSSGLSTTTTIIQSNTSGLTDFGNPYISVKVTYTPSTNTWQLYVRNDGTSFIDPNTGSLTSQGTAVNSTYTGTALGIMGGYWNANIKANQVAQFDNVKVTVVVPTTTSLSPSSAIAGGSGFTLTVNGTGFVNGTSVVKWNGSNRTTTYVSATQLTATISAADIATSGTASVTVANGVAVSNAQTFTIDAAGVPVLTLSTTALASQSTTTGTASSASTYTISGANLTTDPVVTAPTNFEVSKDGTNYAASVTLARTGNTITGQPLTLYSRIKASAPAGIYSNTIAHTATGATTKNVAVSGTVLSAKPTTQATTVAFSTVTSTSFTTTWTNGNGSNRLVLIRATNAVNASPVNGVSYYSNTSYGNGGEVGTGNYVVYNGTGNSVTITDLQPATTYFVAVYEFNGSGGTENYLTTSPATGNRATINSPVGWQIYAQNTVNTITFDTTVDGVNNGQFQGDGMEPVADPGDLSSNAFAVTGFSDGSIAFGGTTTADTDYDRGVSTSGVAVGGLYAFQPATNNSILGIQPATGDFTPGSVTLRLQNQTGAAVTSINIGFKVYVYNDQPASSSFNFSYSSDNSTYTSASGLNVTSPAAADTNPGWKTYYRVITLTGLNIANNNYYYLRWTGATVSGSGAFDAFGLDDIVMVVNPTSNFVPFNGTAENFVVQGNTNLSGDTTVNSDITFNGGKVDIGNNTLTLNGTITNTTTQGIKSNGNSNLTISGTVSPTLSIDQTTIGTTNTFNNFSVNTTSNNTVALSNAIVVNGTLTTAANQTLNLGTTALTGTLATIANNGTITTQNTSATPIPSGKTWGGTGVLNFNAATQQTLVAGTYTNVTVTTAGGVVAAASLTVNGILNLPTVNPSSTVGSLSMGIYTLTMGANATNAGNGDVSGIITRNSITHSTLYTFGSTYTSIIFPNTGTLPSAMSLKVVLGTAPSWAPGAINRTYDFIQTGGSGTKAVIKAHYLDSELNGNIESKLVDWAHINPTNTTLEQGRSNYSTTENWVELTNVNVGLYFASTFGIVSLTLDESAAGALTWNGSVSDSWTTAANWTPNATPSDATAVFIPDAATTPNDPTLNPSVLLGTLDIAVGGILNAPANSQFTINGGAGAWINNGTFNPGTGTSAVIFTNADATIAGTTTFNNITVNSGAGLRPLTNNYMAVAGAFTNNGSLYFGSIENTVEYTGTNQAIAAPNGGLQAYRNLIINGTGTVFPSSLNITRNLTLNQAVNFSGKTITMIGTEPQIINGTSSPTFDNLTLINGSYVALTNNTTVSGTLSLEAMLHVGTKILTLGNAAVSGTFDNTKMIVVSPTGEVRRTFTTTGSYTFPIGEITDTTEYSPITVNVTAGSFSSAYVGVTVVDAIHPNNNSYQNNISRYWNVTESGITGAVATVTATYLPEDILGTEADMAAAQLKGTFNQQTNPWVKFVTLGSNTLTASGAVLTAGQTSAFTGIKGAAFTAAITGYGSFCQNEAVTLTAVPTNGDGPYTYSWSNGLGTQETATPSTASVGTTNYILTIKDTNGITATNNADVVVLAPTVGGTVSANQSICSGSQPSNLILSGQTGAVVYWQSASDSSFTSPVNIANTTSTLTGATIGALSATTYFRAVVQNGSCLQQYSTYAIITVSAAPTTATNTSTQTLCSTGTTALSGNAPTVGTGTWSVVSGPSTSSSQFSNVNNPSAVFTSAGGSGDYVVRWTISNSPCTSSYADATITISGSGAPPSATNNSTQTICANTTATLSANTPTVGTGAWSVVSGPSTLTSQFSSLSDPSAVFTPAGGAGAYLIRWTITNFSCTASADATITVVGNTTTATNTSTQTICAVSTATLSGNAPTYGAGSWSVVSGPSTSSGQFSDITNPTAVFTPANGAGTYVVRWTITNAPCTASTADATITVVASPTVATNTSAQTICASATATLSGNTPTVGTGIWSVVSGPSTLATQFSSTSNPSAIFTPAGGAGEYIVRWRITNAPCSTSRADATITVSATSVAGSVSANQAICSGTAMADLTLSSATGSVLYWQSASDAAFTSPTTITNNTETLTGAEVGPLTATTYFRAVVQSGSCNVEYSNYATITIGSTTWNGTAWSNGVPTASTSAIISGNYTSSGSNINACSLTVNNSATVVISSGDTVTLSGALTAVTGSFVTFSNNANLIQGGTTNTNSGAITIKRNSSALKRLDYTLWSSPVAGQNLLAFSPNTMTNRFYTYNTNTNLYDVVADPAMTNFETTKGYLIRMPNNHPTTATVWNGQFSGVPNNGDYSFNILDGGDGKRFNLVGNPYPSPINMNAFVTDTNNSSTITGTLYFWRKTNNAQSPSYCTWTDLGFTSNNEAQVVDPNNVIQTGQGFFVEVTGVGNTVNFTNSMRVDNHANQIFKTAAPIEKHRIWLNVTNTAGAFCQTMVGYMNGATANYDSRIDGKYINDGSIALASLIDGNLFAIQGRALPFDATDVVPLCFKATTAGEYTIAIDHADGMFAGSQAVYLRDNLTGNITDLTTGSYTFNSAAGTFAFRFDIIYQATLGVTTPEFNADQVIVYKNVVKDIVVTTGHTTIATVKVFDIRGRLLLTKDHINANQATLTVTAANEVLLVQVTSDEGITITKKIMY